MSKVHKKEQNIIEKAKLEAHDILLNAKDTASSIISQMNDLSSQDLKEANNLRNKLNDELKKTASILPARRPALRMCIIMF